jgi:hypothetical protein
MRPIATIAHKYWLCEEMQQLKDTNGVSDINGIDAKGFTTATPPVTFDNNKSPAKKEINQTWS